MQDIQEELQVTLKIIGRNVQSRRQELGLSQRDVAQSAGVSRDTVRCIEQGRHDTRCKTLAAVAQALHTTVAELIKDQLP